jgi:small subunit ribosomal protein S20
MANTSAARKSVRNNEKRRIKNAHRRSAVKTAIKKVMTALELESVEQAQMLVADVAAQLARAKSKGVIHPNAAARRLSRLSKRVAKAAHA